MKRPKMFYIAAIIVGILFSAIGALFLVGISAFFMNTDKEDEYKLIKTKSITEISQRVSKLYFWENRDNCIFQFRDEDGKDINIDLAKDIVYFRKCKDDTVCTKTTSNDKYRIYYGSGNVINEQKLMSFVNMCTKTHK